MSILYFDGKAEPNPGEGSGAAVFYKNDTIVFEVGQYLESTTNNQAEYIGLLVGLRKCVTLGIKTLEVRGDSNLVIKQSSGVWKTKDSKLVVLHEEVEALKKQFDSISFVHVKRNLNTKADSLTNSIFEKKEDLHYETKVIEIKSKHIQQDIRTMIVSIEKKEKTKEENKEEKKEEVVKKEVILNEEQQIALNHVLNGDNVFITGPGGVGKSFLIKKIIEELKIRNKDVALTSLTGISALLIGARTIHSWAGVGIGTRSAEDYFYFLRRCRKNITESWRKTHVLIIDEISMMSDELFEKLDKIAQLMRWSEKPFGGLQIVCLGDFFQLPPVNANFVFESKSWNKTIDYVIFLDTMYRQKDPVFQTMLNEIRLGIVSDETDALLKSRLDVDYSHETIEPTKIYPRKAMVETVNMTRLNALEGETFTYTSKINGKLTESLKKHMMVMDDNSQYVLELTLKVGAQVMLISNLNVEDGLVNGRIGIVTHCSMSNKIREEVTVDGTTFSKDKIIPDVVYVLFKGNSVPTKIEPFQWVLEDNEEISRSQIPLILAYAVSCHKSQGSTLDSAYIDIGKNIFEYGQAYVALSRVKSLDALYLHSYSRSAIKAHPKVLAYYESL